MSDTPYVAVVGGANVDIEGRPDGSLVAFDSNPGSVRLSPGGVGRNIAHNLALLGVDVRLVTAFGDDAWGAALAKGCREAGIDVGASLIVPDASTSTYLCVMDEAGEMRVAINDMAILGRLTRERLEERADLLRGAAIVVIDANLSEDTLGWIADTVATPLFADPISVAKAPRLSGVLGSLHTLKPNLAEAEALAGMRADGAQGPEMAARALLDSGLTRVFVSLGADGLLCAGDGGLARLRSLPSAVASATGAGDAMVAALVWAELQGMGIEQAGRAGLAAAALALESERSVNPHMSAETLLGRMGGD